MNGVHSSRSGNDDQKLKDICLQILNAKPCRGMEFFEDVPLGGIVVPFILATDECGFLIDRVKVSPVRECHQMARSLDVLTKREPEARCYAVLAIDGKAMPLEDFVLFCKTQNVFFMEYDKFPDFIAGMFNMSFSV